MLYFAYGMNTNEESMATRCPKAKYLGNYTLYKFLFQFRRVADIDYTGNKKDKVIGTVWDISKDCEKSLDILEGYPTFYTKEYIKTKKGRMMLYIMTARNKTRLLEIKPDWKHQADIIIKCFMMVIENIKSKPIN